MSEMQIMVLQNLAVDDELGVDFPFGFLGVVKIRGAFH